MAPLQEFRSKIVSEKQREVVVFRITVDTNSSWFGQRLGCSGEQSTSRGRGGLARATGTHGNIHKEAETGNES